MRTKRKAFATTMPEPLSSDFISFCVKNGYKYAEALREGIRRLLKPVQYTQQSQSLPRLSRPPTAPKKQKPFITELKAVLSKGVDIYFRKYDHKPNNQIINEAGRIALQKIYDEEELLREVEIK